jgi:hypothetical protein
MVLLLAAAFTASLLSPSTSSAAKSCGTVTNEAGDVRQIAAWKVPCDEAREVGQRWRTRMDNWPRRLIFVRGWRCQPGNTIEGLCDRNQRMIWILTQVGQPVSHLKAYRPQLDRYRSEALMRDVMRSRYGPSWTYAYSRRVECRWRSRLRQACTAVWGIGDSGYISRAQVRLRPKIYADQLIVRGRTVRLNEYCAITRPRSRCTTTKRFGPVTRRIN